jgi:nucleoside 2-deoxyribosyltransferase
VVSIYLASPFGFSKSTLPFLNELRTTLRKAGFVVNDPWELGEPIVVSGLADARKLTEPEKQRFLHELSLKLGRLNADAIDRSDIVLAGLDGSDVDSGTASEVGYACARGKRIFGLRNDLRRSGENEGVVVNLQVQYWIERSGGAIVQTIDELLKVLPRTKAHRR